ncbi:hypothetical protein SpiGrapes_0192 [Sphaerochaeta pleomorpha str. Grapes]|uniref:DUF5666 domain-containing protein n=1 Tax=Sphaerochaeta pleomorpha (strain ATCC BAA-1885 / DSM 22778 / Grapes) TaxID=158190 RepID=G8QU86_SPHPG|nr:hypothetical protein [Sphaerochaeta pleomorpha]AEV28056.1 hypothetical protein SpiGrapes_0192 [Sphaerochaeta pleomorpha str. Grapes]
MVKKTFVIGLCMLSIAGSLFASSALRGSDYVRLGNQGSVTGNLEETDGEWFLTTDDAEKYALHLGNYEVIYPEGISLREGELALVRGFVYGQDISAISVDSEGKTWEFRSNDGRPLWSGDGNRQNANAYTNEGRMQQQVKATPQRMQPSGYGRFESVQTGRMNKNRY